MKEAFIVSAILAVAFLFVIIEGSKGGKK